MEGIKRRDFLKGAVAETAVGSFVSKGVWAEAVKPTICVVHIPHIKIAHEMNIGCGDLTKVNVVHVKTA